LQIANNLLSNAVKFTEKGHVDLSVSVHDYHLALASKLVHDGQHGTNTNRCDAANIVLKLTVTDTGPGIAPERIKRIFQSYVQAKLSDYRKHGGTGLGLSIVSKLVNIMGGTIHVNSEEGKGSTFVVYLPVKVDEDDVSLTCEDKISSGKNGDQDGELALILAPPPVLRRRSQVLPMFKLPPKSAVVLVVDDNDLNRKLLGRMLSQFKVEYVEASNGQEAVDAVKASRNFTRNPNDCCIGLILMDLCMPVLDGYEAIEVIRRDLNVNVPILALTANALEQERDKVLRAGATEFETKPILRRDLHAKCQKYLQGQVEHDDMCGTKACLL
jgi:two-component system chemotaxis sensor kinase CheA